MTERSKERKKKGLKRGTPERKRGQMTPKKERFCQSYVTSFNATRAAKDAGFSPKTAYSIGWELLRKPEIQQRIMQLQSTAANEFNVTKQELIGILMDIAKAKIEDIKDPETGAILPAHEWPDHMKGVISGIETDELYERIDDEKIPIGQKIKVRLWEKTKAVELLNRMFGFNMPDKTAQTTPEGEAVTPVIKIYTVPPKNDDE